jgi:predicted negative regulator of RcsB-dependent stress response
MEDTELEGDIAKKYIKTSNLLDGLAYCDGLIETSTFLASVYYMKGDIILNLGKPQEALDCYEKAIALEPRRVLFYDERIYACLI